MMRLWLFLVLTGLIWPVNTASASLLKVQDATGGTVRLEKTARRIVTLSPHATELVLALGAGDRLVAVADFFDYPPQLKDVPRLSTLGGLDRERLLLERPDLVIGWASGNRPGDLRWLSDSGIPLYLSEPKHLEDIAVDLERLGRLLGLPGQGHRAAQHFRRMLDQACANRRHSPWQTVYYEIWPRPPMTIGGRHWLNEVLTRAHLHNLFADLPRSVVTIAPEALVARPHDLVLTNRPDAQPPRAGVRVIQIDATLGRPGPRIVEGLADLCGKL